MCLLLCCSCMTCQCQNGVNEGESPVCFVVLRNKITDYRLDVLRATKGAHVASVLMCCKKTSWVTFWKKKKVRIPRSFLVINVCNQGKTLCSPCIIRPYRPTKCTFPKLMFLIYDVCYMFRTRGFIFRKTAVYTAVEQYV